MNEISLPGLSLLSVLQRSLNYAKKKSFIHRIIYLIDCTEKSPDWWLKAVEHSVKVANEELGCGVGQWDQLAGLALSSSKYVIIILEGTEDVYNKHTALLRDNIEDCQQLGSLKVMAFIPHINKRWLIGWTNAKVKLPIPLEFREEPKDIERHALQLENLIQDLYFVLKYVHEIPVAEFRQQIGKLSSSCSQYLPPVALLDVLYKSPLLSAVEEISVPDYFPDQERVWPAPQF